MINFLIKYKTELLYINIFRSIIILISYLVSKEYFELSFFYTLKIPFLINTLPLISSIIMGVIMTTAFSLPILLILKKLDFNTEKVIKQSIVIMAILIVDIIIVTISLWLYYFKFNDWGGVNLGIRVGGKQNINELSEVKDFKTFYVAKIVMESSVRYLLLIVIFNSLRLKYYK